MAGRGSAATHLSALCCPLGRASLLPLDRERGLSSLKELLSEVVDASRDDGATILIQINGKTLTLNGRRSAIDLCKALDKFKSPGLPPDAEETIVIQIPMN